MSKPCTLSLNFLILVSNPFGPAKGPQKKPINNPFGDLKVYANDQDETEQLNTQPVNTNQGRGVGNPYRSTTPDPDELQGSITINPAAPKRQASFESQSKPAPINNPFGKTANPQPQPINQPYNQPFNPQQNPRANQQRPENEVYNDPRYRNQPVPEPEFIGNFKKSSWYETILSGLKLIKVANPDLVPNQEAEYIDNDDEFNEPPLLEGNPGKISIINRFGN